MTKVFHVLTESEPFSEHHGGAVSRWVANVLRDDPRGMVLAPSSDSTWPVPAQRVRTVRRLLKYKFLNERANSLLRWSVRMRLLRSVFRAALQDLQAGDTVWVHNRPEFAAALEPFVHDRGAHLVLHLHNSHLVEFSRRVVRAIDADCYVFLSHFLEQEALLKFPKLGRSQVTYSGADDRIFFPASRAQRASPVVLYVGRVVPEKGAHVFSAALRILLDRGVAITGIVLGGASFGDTAATPYIRQLQQEAPANLSFEPYCSGAALGEWFRHADLFCIPSIWQEALGLVVLEAMASRLPVVASRCGGIPELLSAGGGLLVEPDSAMQLADALELLATNTGLRCRLADQAYQNFCAGFTWEQVRENYRRILESLKPDAGPATVEDECATFPTSA